MQPDPLNGDTARLLIVDDEPSFTTLLASQLEAYGHFVTVVGESSEAVERYAAIAPDVVILDLTMPGMDGMQVLGSIRRIDAAAGIILLSGTIDVRGTVRALRAGAEDVLPKPVDFELLNAAIERGLRRSHLVRSNRVATTQAADPYGFLDDSPAMRRVLRTVEQLSQMGSPVLITGEPGTGKHVVAEMLHQLSPRADRPFVRVTAGGTGDTNIKDALKSFGGPLASRQSSGDRLTARGGTLFLQGVATLTSSEQELLLTLLTGTLAGESRAEAAVRVIASTERDLSDDVRAGRLGAGLFQRLASFPVALPPLRARGEEAIRHLAVRMLHALREAVGHGPEHFADESLRTLAAADWPGNVRQLRAVIEEAFIGAIDSEVLEAAHLRDVLRRSGAGERAAGRAMGEGSLAQMERRHIARVLAETGGNRSEAARILDITRTTLYKKIYAFGLEDVGGAGT